MGARAGLTRIVPASRDERDSNKRLGLQSSLQFRVHFDLGARFYAHA
jgi:hypothetical protein